MLVLNTINCGPTGGPSKPNVDINEKTPEGSKYEPYELNARALEINLDLKSLHSYDSGKMFQIYFKF